MSAEGRNSKGAALSRALALFISPPALAELGRGTPLDGAPILDQQVPLCRSGPVWASCSAACAAASRAVNSRKGEQDT